MLPPLKLFLSGTFASLFNTPIIFSGFFWGGGVCLFVFVLGIMIFSSLV